MSDIEKRYIWLVKHLIWNASRKENNHFWIKVSEEDAKQLCEKYEIVETRTLLKGVQVSVIRMLNNNIVLDTRNNENYI